MGQDARLDDDLTYLRDRLVDRWHKQVDGLEPFPTRYARVESTRRPYMVLENVMYRSKKFRKLHVEIGATSDGFQVLHCVLFPRTSYPTPIFGADVIKRNHKVTFCIADCSPVSEDLVLPPEYRNGMDMLQTNVFSRPPGTRTMPEWGRAIFSDRCVCYRPIDDHQRGEWFRYVVGLSSLYLNLAEKAYKHWNHAGVEHGHARYVFHQRENQKTRTLLARYFSEDFADRYVEEVLFDDTESA